MIGSDFSGVGAFDQALMRLNIAYKTIFACDMDKNARQTYIENYGEPKYFPLNVYDRDIPIDSLDIYMTSPPCQAFSLAGKRKGEGDNRGLLFYNSHEFILKNRPRFFIFENVKGLLSDDGGKTFQRWIDFLAKSVNGSPMIFPHEESAGYHVYHAVLNSKDYGVPQNRERVFIIGIRDDKDNSFRFPKPQPMIKRLKNVLEDGVDKKYFLSELVIEKLIKYNYRNKEAGNGFRAKFHNIESDIMGALKVGGGCCGDIVRVAEYRNDEGLRFFKDGVCGTIRTIADGGDKRVIKNGRIRRLTPRECFRLQDFPETFNWSCSDTQAYKQAGNSITVGVLAAIIKNLK